MRENWQYKLHQPFTVIDQLKLISWDRHKPPFVCSNFPLLAKPFLSFLPGAVTVIFTCPQDVYLLIPTPNTFVLFSSAAPSTWESSWHTTGRVTIDADEQNQWTDQDNMSRKGYVLLFCGAGGRGLGHWATPLTWQERLFKYMSCFPMCAIRTTTQQPLLVRSKGPLVFNWNNKRLGSDSLSPSAPLFLACVRQRWQHLLLIGNPHVS